MSHSYSKLLTKNDTGETGGHQGGICVPHENIELIKFFPHLNPSEFNPEAWITCIDSLGAKWEMRYVYYNGKTLTPAKSTRNEYRLTCMTKFFKKWNAKSGDSVIFTSTPRSNIYEIGIVNSTQDAEEMKTQYEPKLIKLQGWNRIH